MVQQRLPEARAGRDQRHVASALRLPLLQHVHLGVAQHRHRVGHGLQIVQQEHALQLECARDASGVHAPRHIRELGSFIDHGTGDAKAGRIDRVRAHRFVPHELPNHRWKVVEGERPERAHDDRLRTRSARIEEPEERLGSTDVAGQQHEDVSLYN